MLHSVIEWQEILHGLPPVEAAKRILGDITHYQSGRAYEQQDMLQLAAAMRAFVANEIEAKS